VNDYAGASLAQADDFLTAFQRPRMA